LLIGNKENITIRVSTSVAFVIQRQSSVRDSPEKPKPLTAGVIGVGSMGRHHARIYSELPSVSLGGVYDANPDIADTVATEYGTRECDMGTLLEDTDIVSVAVPTEYHYEIVKRCLEADVHVLVEKPFVEKIDHGKELNQLATNRGLVLQVGHIERFNPATQVLADIMPDLDVVAIDIQRLGPPVERGGDDSVIMDLMIHDIDIVLSLLEADLNGITALAHNRQHATVQFRLGETVTSLTASRLTQQKVRQLSVTAHSCRVNVDFIDQSIEIHRHSLPEYVETNGDVRYRHETVVEQPMVENGEPLKGELTSFIRAVENGGEPVVGAADAIRALEVAREIESIAFEESLEVSSP